MGFFCFLLLGRLARIGETEELLALFEAVSLGADLGFDVQVDRLLDVLLELGNFLERQTHEAKHELDILSRLID